jgi:thiol:disulfide interchange protein DsbD
LSPPHPGAGAIPKPGPWLSVIKHVFGLIFIGMAIWIVSRVIPQWATILLAGLFLAATGVALLVNFLRRQKPKGAWSTGILVIGLIALIPGSLAAVAALDGSSVDVLQMLGLSTSKSEGTVGSSPFERVTTTKALDLAIESAGHEGKAVVLDFTADWCVECKIMDRTVFANPEVIERLRDVRLIKADASDYNEDTRSLMSRFNVVGPPTILFMKSKATSEVPDTRIIGPVDARTFLARLDRLHPTTTLTKSGE